MGPKLMNCCKPEQVGTKEYGKLLKRIQVLEMAGSRRRRQETGRMMDEKRRITRKEYQRLQKIKFEMEGFKAQKFFWNLVREKVLQDRGALLQEEGDVIREYKAMHEENFLSSWLTEEGKDKEERIRMEIDKETKEETSKKRTREEEKEENETVSAERRCVGSVSAETFDIFSQGEDSESCGCFSWCDLLKNPDDLSDCEPETRTDVSAVPDVTVVLVSPSSVVTEHFEDVSLDSDWEFVEPLCFSFSKKRSSELEEESRRDGLRRVASKSASEYQKKDDAASRHSKFRILRRMKASGKRSWKRKASGAFRKEG